MDLHTPINVLQNIRSINLLTEPHCSSAGHERDHHVRDVPVEVLASARTREQISTALDRRSGTVDLHEAASAQGAKA
jgi:hypothetical protein